MKASIEEARERLDYIINIARVDLYKPIQIAEVLWHCRMSKKVNPLRQETYRNASLRWRNEVTRRLSGKASTSSARYQHDVWNQTAMPPHFLKALDEENKKTKGMVERYIYLRYAERQGTVTEILTTIEKATPATFHLTELLALFISHSGIRRSIDKAYEIITYSLFETIIVELGLTVKISASPAKFDLLREFSDLTRVLIGLDVTQLKWEQSAHLYRVGVTNAADRGLDMWANFGPAVQVKHLTLDKNLANLIVEQVESDHVVIVCKDAEADVIETVMKQIGWGRRVRGIIKEAHLVDWYERCLRGSFRETLGPALLARLTQGFKAEFPQTEAVVKFLEERDYLNIVPDSFWKTETDIVKASL
jgi:type II restriction enzyme